MAKEPNIQVQVQTAVNQNTGKRRLMIDIVRDEWMQVTFFLHADKAEEFARALLEIAQEVRGRNVIIPSS